MELKIKEYQIPSEISGNFDELKAEVAERVAYYKDLVYTDEQMKEAKADRARLRKLIDAIDAQRKQVKADLLAPYNALESKLNEIKALVQEPINMIDNQVKAYEELQKETKTESIKQTFANKGCPFDPVLIWNQKWLNTTYSMKKIGEEIDAAMEKYNADMKTLEALPEYSFEAIEAYKNTMDLGQAMVYANELKEQAKRKAEYEAMKKEAERSGLPLLDPEKFSSPLDDVPRETEQIKFIQEPTCPEQTDRMWIRFEAYMSVPEAVALKNFFEMNHIEFRKA